MVDVGIYKDGLSVGEHRCDISNILLCAVETTGDKATAPWALADGRVVWFGCRIFTVHGALSCATHSFGTRALTKRQTLVA